MKTSDIADEPKTDTDRNRDGSGLRLRELTLELQLGARQFRNQQLFGVGDDLLIIAVMLSEKVLMRSSSSIRI